MFLKRFSESFQFVLTRFCNNFSSKSFYIFLYLFFIFLNHFILSLVFIFCEKIFFLLYPFIQNIAAHYVHENLGV